MITVILTIHSLVVLALIAIVLLQRSEGGALGIGGGGGGFMSSRGAANTLTRTTSILAAVFFATSLVLGILAGQRDTDESVIRDLTGQEGAPAREPGAPTTTDDLLRTLEREQEAPPSDGSDLLEAGPAEAAPAEDESPAETPVDAAAETPPGEDAAPADPQP